MLTFSSRQDRLAVKYATSYFHLLVWAALSWTLAWPAAAAESHPFLADGASNEQWHAPATSDEAVFIGDAAKSEPKLTLKKASFGGGVLEIQIQSDAKRCVLNCGQSSLPVTLDTRDSQLLALDGDPIKPNLMLDGRELAPLRGRWIVLFLKENDGNITCTFEGASFVNLKFRAVAGAKTNALSPAAVIGAAREPVGSDTQENPAPIEGASAGPIITGPIITGPIITPSESNILPPTTGSTSSSPYFPTPITGPAASGPTPGEIGQYDKVLAPVNEWDIKLRVGGDLSSARFYRGIGQENQGLVLSLFADASIVFYEDNSSGIFDFASVDFGISTHHYSGPSGGKRANSNEKLVEIDGYGGITVGFMDRWALSAYPRQRVAIGKATPAFDGDVHSFDLILRYDDASEAFDWKLSPYFVMSFEYEGQSDLISKSDNRNSLSVYFEAGVRPQFELFRWNNRPVHLTVPVTMGLSIRDYYQDPFTKDDDLFGFLEVGLELSGTLLQKGMSGTSRTLDIRWMAGLYFLYLGDNAAAISERNGTSGDALNVVGKIGISINY